MDPNATLAALREWQQEFQRAAEAMDSEAYDHALCAIAELAQELDEWLSRGGFLPDAWRRDNAAIDVQWNAASDTWLVSYRRRGEMWAHMEDVPSELPNMLAEAVQAVRPESLLPALVKERLTKGK